MRRTIGEEVKLVSGMYPATKTATTSSEPIVDTLGFDNVCWEVSAGDGTFVDETYSFQVLEDSDSAGGSAVAISGAVVAITADNTLKKIQIQLGGGRERYQFIRLTAAGSNKSLIVSCTAILAKGDRDPAQAPNVSV